MGTGVILLGDQMLVVISRLKIYSQRISLRILLWILKANNLRLPKMR